MSVKDDLALEYEKLVKYLSYDPMTGLFTRVCDDFTSGGYLMYNRKKKDIHLTNQENVGMYMFK